MEERKISDTLTIKDIKIGDMVFFEKENYPNIVTGTKGLFFRSHKMKIEKAGVTKVNRKQHDGSWKLYHVVKEEE
jgi:predicted RNA-binding protein with PUA-like domain